jgi:hypothetical protein
MISTSIGEGNWSGAVKLVIEAPAGTRARYVGGDADSSLPHDQMKAQAEAGRTNPITATDGAIASMPSEFELLLERGTTFRVLEVTPPVAVGAPWTVRVRVVSQGVGASPAHT